ncbi:MAG TPA: arylamine N-acetyltransferase [Myxococcales bacterium]|nr:arylamine N-acetyltransferase [Myxococcales bacterium]
MESTGPIGEAALRDIDERTSGLDVGRYLERIGYAGSTSPTLETLRQIHLAHLRTIPFENLSVRRGEPIALEVGRLFEKIVLRRRGGFCYELNGLFAALLDALGFRVSRLAGTVTPAGIAFDHLALRVDLDEPWLADVGFGDSFVLPLRLDDREPQAGGCGRRYRLDAAEGGLLLLREEEQGWERQYLFALRPWPLSAFEGGCRYHQTSPKSSFTQKTVISRATETGRITLSGRRLIVTSRGSRAESDLQDDAAVAAALAEHFGIR